MKIIAGTLHAHLATVRLDGRIVNLVTRADDRAGYVDMIRMVDRQVVSMVGPDGVHRPVIDRHYGRVAISLHHSTRRRLHLHVPSFASITRSETRT